MKRPKDCYFGVDVGVDAAVADGDAADGDAVGVGGIGGVNYCLIARATELPLRLAWPAACVLNTKRRYCQARNVSVSTRQSLLLISEDSERVIE